MGKGDKSGSDTFWTAAKVVALVAVIGGIGAAVYGRGSGADADRDAYSAGTDSSKAVNESSIDIENVDNESEDNEEITPSEEETKKQISAAYQDAISQAVKRQKGGQWNHAAEKYSEAIDLMHKMNSADQTQEMALLYNNRSAMYEKVGDSASYKKALDDIRVVLLMDATHAKARLRRARVLESQGKLQESLTEYTIHFLLEQSKGVPQPASQSKVEELSKSIAFDSASKSIDKMRSGTTKESDLPNKAYCRTFFELLPSTHLWRGTFEKSDVDDLIRVFNDANDSNNLGQLMDVVKCAVTSNAYHTAFKYLEKDAQVLPADESDARPLLALRARLQGMQKQLKRNLSGAIACYKDALSYGPDDIDSMLLLAGCYLELGDGDAAQNKFDEILGKRSGSKGSHLHSYLTRAGAGEVIEDGESLSINDVGKEMLSTLSANERIELAYCCFHRSSLWIARDSAHQFRKDVIKLANQDISLALEALKGLGDSTSSDLVARKIYLLTLLKRIQLVGQTKGLAGETQTQEDIELCKNSIEEASALEPSNPQVIMINSDVLAMEEKFEEALMHIEKLFESNADDGIPYVMKANMLTHQGMKFMQIGQMEQNHAMLQQTQACLAQAQELYEEALRVEPNCVEAMAQACQLRCICGDVVSALKYAEMAVPLARNADELRDLEVLRVQTSSQVAGFQEIMKIQGAQ